MQNQSHVANGSPKVLVVSALPYIFSAKLARGLRDVGFTVAVVCPNNRHPIHHLRHPPKRYALGVAGANSFGPFGACARIARAINRFAPDLVIPCDDYAAQILHSIAVSARPSIKRVLERSLGPTTAYPLLESRTAQVALARRRKIRTPRFRSVGSEQSLSQALGDIGLPAFIKRDDSWAGQGIKKIADDAEAYRAFRELSRQHSVRRALSDMRRVGVRHALAGIRKRRPNIHLQAAIRGQPANRTAVCVDGKVIAGFSVIAVETSSETGPATVVRVADCPEMAAAVDVLAGELRLSGLVGFDFVLGESGEAYFLEINARATPSATLSLAGSPDLLGTLLQTVTAAPVEVRRPSVDADTIAFFPDEMLRDESSPFLASAYHDIPTDEPGLVDYGIAQGHGEAQDDPA